MAKWTKFEELPIWQDARILAKDIYGITSNIPFARDYRFCSHIRAAAGSIMDNIAEGFEKENNKEFIQFLYVSKGSCGEVRSQLHRARDVEYISDEIHQDYSKRVLDLSSAISNFIRYLKDSEMSGSRHIK